MTGSPDPYSTPPAVLRIARMLRIAGWFSFWAQAILAIVAGIVLMFAVTSINISADRTNPESGIGFFFATIGLLLLLAGVYWAFRYTRLSLRLRHDAQNRPRPKEVVRTIQMGLMINLGGMFVTLLGAEAIVGSLLAKALSQPQGGGVLRGDITQFVQSLDIFVVQANTHTILAHFAGVVASLLLLRTVSR